MWRTQISCTNSLTDSVFSRARMRFSGLVGPLLDGLAAHTGYEISLFAGRRKEVGEKIEIECLRCVLVSSAF